MTYHAEILVRDTENNDVWRAVHATGKAPYTFETAAEAWRMLDMCYPDIVQDNMRVVEVK